MAIPYLHLRTQNEYSSERKELLRKNSIQDKSKLTPETEITTVFITGLKVQLIIHVMVKKKAISYSEGTR